MVSCLVFQKKLGNQFHHIGPYYSVTVLLFSSKLEIPASAQDLSKKHDFEIQGYKSEAAKEQLRTPRIVRFAVIQNKIVLPTDVPLEEQVH